MASKEGNVDVPIELQQEQPHGREEQVHTESRCSKFEAPTGESLKPRVASLESHMEDMRTIVGKLFDQIDNLIQENGEISCATKAMIEELGNQLNVLGSNVITT